MREVPEYPTTGKVDVCAERVKARLRLVIDHLRGEAGTASDDGVTSLLDTTATADLLEAILRGDVAHEPNVERVKRRAQTLSSSRSFRVSWCGFAEAADAPKTP
jgi:hypothetical protein